MKHKKYVYAGISILLIVLASGISFADQKDYARKYRVTITNLTRGQIFSRPIVISHNRNFRLFELGEPASDELVALAEDADLSLLIAQIDSHYNYALGPVSDLNPNGVVLPGPSATVEIAGERFTLEIAADDPSRSHGLKGRPDIPADGGMLFVFPRVQRQSFWMEDCLVDIDVMFLDAQGRVTATHTMKVEPPRRSSETLDAYRRRLRGYSSVYPAQFAIELKAGTIDRLDIEIDRKIELDLPRLKAMAR